MKKPNNFDETQVGGNFTPIEVGGHHAVILSVKEQKSSTGKDMVVVALDFAKNDSQAGYFKKQFNEDDRQDKKWPYQAVQYIVTEGSDGKCTKSFKGFVTSFENSNGKKVNWGDAEAFCKQFVNKKIGVVYGEVEEEYNGEVKTRRRIRWFCSDDKVDSQPVPEKKLLDNKPSGNSGSSSSGSDDGFMTFEGSDDQIPF